MEDLLAYHTADKFQSNQEPLTKSSVPTPAKQRAPFPAVTAEHYGGKSKSKRGSTPQEGCDSDASCEKLLCKRPKLDSVIPCVASCGNGDNSETGRQRTGDVIEGSAHQELKTCSDPQRPGFDPANVTCDPKCPECRKEYVDPQPGDLVMFLHAYRYQVWWLYTCSVPQGPSQRGKQNISPLWI